MTQNKTFRAATSNDYDEIVALLKEENLPTEDLSKELPHFFVIESDGRIAGAIGLELHERQGLLRSMIVHKDYRNRAIASTLVNELLQYATGAGIENVYLITTTAEGYFAKKGFDTIDRKHVAPVILSSSEFSSLCPSTATVMVKKI